jgi:hypothetical protein
MSLPLPWVERIFQKLTLNFGRDFTSRWEGVPLDEVKSDWAFELRGFQQNPAAIKHGIETTINGKPPTAQEFKAACLRYESPTVLIANAPASAEVVQEQIRRSRVLVNHSTGNKDWAHRLKARADVGEILTAYQKMCYREALKIQ